MYKVKLSIARDNERCNRQLPGGGYIWKGYEFVINQPCEEADFWVVYSKGNRQVETCRVSPENTLFITGEPDSVYHYSIGFINQFAKVLSCQKGLDHKCLSFSQPAQPWHIGKQVVRNSTGKEIQEAVEYTQTYDTLKVSAPQKTKLMSVITSNKAFTKGHRERIKFVKKLKEHYGHQLDLFGWGFNSFKDKWDTIAPYKYHIAIENCCSPHYWTEKLADSYLGNAFPFYIGCDNIGEYFDKDAFLMLDIHDVEGSIRIIDQAIAEDVATKQAAAIESAKQLVLDKYNLFNLIVENLQDMNPSSPKMELTLKPDSAFIDLPKIYVMGVKRVVNKINAKLKK